MRTRKVSRKVAVLAILKYQGRGLDVFGRPAFVNPGAKDIAMLAPFEEMSRLDQHGATRPTERSIAARG